MNHELRIILAILENVSHSYSNPDGGEVGTIRWANGEKSMTVKADNYERAIVIRQAMHEDVPMERIYEAKKILFGL